MGGRTVRAGVQPGHQQCCGAKTLSEAKSAGGKVATEIRGREPSADLTVKFIAPLATSDTVEEDY
jgi:hypothetical protein